MTYAPVSPSSAAPVSALAQGAGPDLPALRCGTHGISVAELILLKTLFRLYSHDAGFRWELVEAAPYDAILVDEHAVHSLPSPEWTNVRAVLTLGASTRSDGDGDGNTMARPLRSEKLQAWLTQAEQTFFTVPAGLQEGLASLQDNFPADDFKTPFQVSFVDTMSDQPAPPPRPAPAAPALRPLSLQAADEGSTYKLLRWPPSAMLRNDPRLIRMATVLSRRAMRVGELAQLSQQPEEDAGLFVQALRSAGMLDIRAGAVPLPTTRAASAAGDAHRPGSRTEKNGRRTERGLVSRIRLRLGL